MSILSKLMLLILCSVKIRFINSLASSILCTRIPGLSAIQKKMCIESPDVFVALGAGHILGSKECEYQFQGHRWNCSHVWKKEVFGQVVPVGSREAAFTYAIASAASVFKITQSCAKGNISICGCDRLNKKHTYHQNQEWKWGGCSVDISFGTKYTRKFLNLREIEGDARSLMNLHNNRLGRKMVQMMLKKSCKCHGVSGSCALKTCWKSLPLFRSIGHAIKNKYNKAKMAQAISDKTRLTLVIKRKNKLPNDAHKLQRPKRMEMLYISPSPNYCEKDLTNGSWGTMGRYCDRTAKGIEGCDLLCCGKGYTTHELNRTWPCHCKFQWCCHVKCDACTERIEEYTCN